MENEEIFRNATYKQAITSLMAWCARAERSIFDVQQRIKKMQIDEPLSTQLLTQLQNEGFVNNQRFVDAYVHDTFHYNKWGVQKIKQSLYAKGIDRKMVDEAYERIISQHEQESLLEKELLKKRKSLGELPAYQLKAKLLRFAASRGYDMDQTFSCLDRIIHLKDES